MACIRKAVQLLPDERQTKKDVKYLSDQIAIHNQADWESVGASLLKEFSQLTSNPFIEHESKRKPNILHKTTASFIASSLGQNIKFEPFELEHGQKHDIRELYDTIRMENVLRLAIHFARDFANKKSADYISLFNTVYLTNSDKLRSARVQYFPQAGLGGVGNLQYRFPEGAEAGIAALQFYSSWTDYTEWFLKPEIARTLADISAQIIENKISRNVRTRLFTTNRKLLLGAPCVNTVQFAADLLSKGDVKQRIEGVWTTKPTGEALPKLMSKGWEVTETWLKEGGLLEVKKVFTYFKKVEVKDWIQGTLLHCSKTIRSAIRPFENKQAINATSIFEIPNALIMNPDVFRSVAAAEYLLASFLKGQQNGWEDKSQSLADTLGTHLPFSSRTTFVFKNISVESDGTLKYIGPEDQLTVPQWIMDPRLPLLRVVKDSILSDNAAISIALLSFLLGNALHIAGESLPNPFNIFPHNLKTASENRIVMSSDGIITKFQRDLLKGPMFNTTREGDIGGMLIRLVFKYKGKCEEPYTAHHLIATLDHAMLEAEAPFLVPFPGEACSAIPASWTIENNEKILIIWTKVFNWWKNADGVSCNLSKEEESRLKLAMKNFHKIPPEEKNHLDLSNIFESLL